MNGIEAGIEVMNETRKALLDADLGLSRGLRKLNQLLEATKPRLRRHLSCIKGKDADGGSVVFVDIPDNQTQIKALDMLLNLGDYYPSKKINAEVNHLVTELPPDLQAMFDKIYSKGEHDQKRSAPEL